MKSTTFLLATIVSAALGSGCVSAIHQTAFNPETVKANDRTVAHAPYKVTGLTLVHREDPIHYWREKDAEHPGLYASSAKASEMIRKDELGTASDWFKVPKGTATPSMVALAQEFLFAEGNDKVKALGLPGHTMGMAASAVPVSEEQDALKRLVRETRLAPYGWPAELTAESLNARLVAERPELFSDSGESVPLHVLVAFTTENRDYHTEFSPLSQRTTEVPSAGLQTFGVWVLSGIHTPVPGKAVPKPGVEFEISYASKGFFGSLFGSPLPGDSGKIQARSYAWNPQGADEYRELVGRSLAAAVVEALNGLPDDLFETVLRK